MAISDLFNLTKLLGGGELSQQEKQDLLKEVLLLTLSRASSSDTNIHPVEISVIQNILKGVTGEEFSDQQIHVSARSELYETRPLEAYLESTTKTLSETDRALVASSLATVIKSDEKITYNEVNFFNTMAAALKLTPASIAGLIPV